MAAPKEILQLVEKFERNRDEYLSPSFNEATLRQEFLNPFFKVLGWDVDNTQGHAMAYREVIHEAARGCVRNHGAVPHKLYEHHNLLSVVPCISQQCR